MFSLSHTSQRFIAQAGSLTRQSSDDPADQYYRPIARPRPLPAGQSMWSTGRYGQVVAYLSVAGVVTTHAGRSVGVI